MACEYTERALSDHCRVNMAHTKQSRPYSGIGFQVKALETFNVFPLRSETVARLPRTA